MISLTMFVLLTGCAAQQPGGFSKVDTDKSSHSVQLRYKPADLDQSALNSYITQRCQQQGFDKVEALPEEDSALPGQKTRWYQCNYQVKN